MSIEAMSLKVPQHQREGFLARAAGLVQRAEANRVSRTELALALGVLSVLCGAASAPARSAEPTVRAEP